MNSFRFKSLLFAWIWTTVGLDLTMIMIMTVRLAFFQSRKIFLIFFLFSCFFSWNFSNSRLDNVFNLYIITVIIVDSVLLSPIFGAIICSIWVLVLFLMTRWWWFRACNNTTQENGSLASTPVEQTTKCLCKYTANG